MKLYLKYHITLTCKKALQDQLDKMQLTYSLLGFNEVEINEDISGVRMKQITESLSSYGIEVLDNPKSILIQKIKDAITELVYMEENLPTVKISTYLANKLGYGYGYISNLFSEVTFTSIENYIILQKTERAKQLIITNHHTVTEIAWKLNYSSVAHFSNQFKAATGLTPTTFQRIINKRRNALNNMEINSPESKP